MSLSKAIGIINGINEFGNFFQLLGSAASYMRSQWMGSQAKKLEEDDILQEKKLEKDDVLQLQSDLRCLRETLPAMYNLIDRAE